MNIQQPVDQRLAEIREALMHTDWRAFDRDDVTMLVNEVDRLQAELRTKTSTEENSKGAR